MEGKKRPGFMYYYDEFNPVFFNICDEDTGRLFKALISYDLDRTEPDFPEGSMLGVLFRVLLPKLEYSERKYRETCEKRRTAANIRWKNQHQDVQPDACICTAEAAEDANNNRNTNPNNNSNPNKRENKEKRTAGFVKPSRAELRTAAPDYFTGSDGRRFCRRCRQPLETFIPCLPGRRIPCICRCMEEEDRRERMQAAVRSRKSACFTNRRSWELTFENSLMEDSKLGLVKAYADKWPDMRRHGRGLLLTGPVGTGKSHAACCLANYLCEKDIAVRMVTLAEVLNGLQSVPDRNAYIKALAENSALLIIDDFGIERDTNYAAEQVFSLIDCRYKSGKPLVATTNLPLSKLKTETDIRYKRIFDRLTAMCEPILFDGRNMRDLRREENHCEMKKSLVGD